jgi:hypothetical protein
MSNEFYSNGFLVRSKSNFLNQTYFGVESYDNWPLNDLFFEKKTEELAYFEEYFNEYIDISWTGDSVDVCCDINFIKRYIKECNKNNIDVEIIFCKTTLKKPICGYEIATNQEEKLFIGYDYAYPGGSYYSCINNDIVSGRISEFKKFKLNKYGLFEKLEEVNEFINKRNELKDYLPQNTFEEGEFIIYKLYNMIDLKL